ncbi:MAG: DegT/DnrJ/EryC1/StrS family aminotransferase [Alphaproteobacteria bacterium]|nr:DegT/DnrJ/EryC1/StrS family aminotransferase [Alphaproteobacteria bacterium]
MAKNSIVELGPPNLGQAEKDALCEVIESGWITMGDRVKAFESAFSDMHDVENAVAVSSATAALHLSLVALGIGPRDEVLVPSMTFVATVNTVMHTGATPVMVDIESVTRPHMSLADAETKLTERSRAVVIMHYGGYMMDLSAWRDFADKHGLFLIEDAAHAAGIADTARSSDAAAFSFFANKNMTTAEGGMVLLRDADLADRVRTLRSHGMTSGTLDRVRGRAVGYDVVGCGYNYRIDELRAALGLVQLDRLQDWNAQRVKIIDDYRMTLAATTPAVATLFDDDHVTSGHIMPVLLPAQADRTDVMARLKAEFIQSSVHYPPVHRFSYFADMLGEIALPHTDAFGARQLTLPLHPGLNHDDVVRVVKALKHALPDRCEAVSRPEED